MKEVLIIDKNSFLKEQLELLKRKQIDVDLEWQDIADFRSEYVGSLEHRHTSRKGSKLLYEYIDAGWVKSPEEISESDSSEEIIKLKKEQIKTSDQRIELNRLIREQARKESFLEMVQNVICKNVEPININVDYNFFVGENDLLCHLTDIHTGIKIDNWKNTFDENVLRQRIEKYTSDILKIRDLHESQDCYIVVGEILSGLIHNNLRLQNNMNLMEQFKYVAELISSMLIKLAERFNHIYMYTTPGNHSRIVAKKDDSIDGENMDVLLPFYLKARLQNIENISVCDNNIEPEIAMFNIRGNNVFSAHGHKDSPKSVVQNFTMLFGIKPDIVLLGHRHTNGLTTVYDTKVIESGCVSGSDDWIVSHRKANKPEQTVSVIDSNGLKCLYDIQLN